MSFVASDQRPAITNVRDPGLAMFFTDRRAQSISMQAALRDADERAPMARLIAARCLAPRYFETLALEMEVSAPHWDASALHELGTEVKAAALKLADDPDGYVRDAGLFALGQLGAPEAIAMCAARLEQARSVGADLRAPDLSGAAEALGALAQAAWKAEQHDAADQAQALLEAQHDSPSDAVRYHAAIALAELLVMRWPSATDEHRVRFARELAARLSSEQSNDVRVGYVEAIELLAAAADADVLHALCELAIQAAETPAGYQVGLVLAPLRRPEALAPLRAALLIAHLRDDALEAIALIGPLCDEQTGSQIRKLANGWLVTAITRVRAAYALARWRPSEGLPLLARHANSLRPDVREAAAQAQNLLATLQEQERATAHPFRG